MIYFLNVTKRTYQSFKGFTKIIATIFISKTIIVPSVDILKPNKSIDNFLLNLYSALLVDSSRISSRHNTFLNNMVQ